MNGPPFPGPPPFPGGPFPSFPGPPPHGMGMGMGPPPFMPMGGPHMRGPPFMGPGPGPMGMLPPGRGMPPPPVATTPGLVAGVKRAAAAHADRPRLSSSAPSEKSTMVSVGKIASSVDNKTMQTLLEACGLVKSWKRAEDPETKALKGFGFCEFEDAEGVLRAIRLLNGFKVDGQELVIKGNSATQRYVEEYEEKKAAQRQAQAQARLEAAKKKHEEGEVIDEGALQQAAITGLTTEEQEQDNKALEVIMSVVSEREEASASKQRALPPPPANASEFLQQMERGDLPLPGPPAHEDKPGGGTDKGKERDRDRDRSDKHRDRGSERGREERDEHDAERDRRRALDREFDARLRDWERYEMQRNEGRERERHRQEQAEKERWRQCRQDLEASDTEDEVPPWARKPYRTSRRCMERRRRRLAEEEADAIDRQREQREMGAVSDRKRRRSEQQDDEGSAGGVPHPSRSHHHSSLRMPGVIKEESEVKAEPSEASAAAGPTSPEVDETDPIYKAMMAAATSAPRPQNHTSTSGTGAPISAAGGSGAAGLANARPGDRLLHHATHDPHAAVKSEHRHHILRGSESPPPSSTSAAAAGGWQQPQQPMQQAAAAAGGAQQYGGGGGGRPRGSAVATMFGDEDEVRIKRVLKPIQYSEDELKVAEEIEREQRAATARAAAAAQQQGPGSAAGAAAVDAKQALKSLMDRIPTTKDGVWAYPIKWGQYNAAMKQRFSQWVDAKVTQLLGAPEASVVSFILDLIGQNKSPAGTATELEALLESDTETFVIKLYRTVIFETERAAAGL